jgi:NADH-quinone oxidoreductase subunit N
VSDDILKALVSAFPLLVPEAILVLAACVLFVGTTFKASGDVWAWASLLSLALAGVALFYSPHSSLDSAYAAPLYVDRLALFIKWTALAGGAVLVLFSWNEVPDRWAAEYHACVLVIVAGLCLTGSANELVTLFLALELISIPTYIILYLPRYDAAAQEASMKYFLLSVFSSGLLLFGFSYLYGLSGTTNLPALIEALNRDESPRLPAVALIALVMVVAGLGFKITAVPFHYYAPDVYQGAPTGVAALLAFMPKAAGFVALLRVLGFIRVDNGGNILALGDQVSILFWILAAVTMSLGNILALWQHNIKRLLAYSSVAHAGYMLIGLAVAYPLTLSTPLLPGGQLPGGAAAVLFYVVAYGAMTVGAFGVLSYLSTPERPVETDDDLAGLSQSHPGVALLMALFLFSLIGIPLTGGFFGKMLLFLGAITVETSNARLFRWLAVIGAVNAAIGAFYYLRILVKMYLHPAVQPVPPRHSWSGLTMLWICAALTLGLGIYPKALLDETVRIVAPTGQEMETPAREAHLP